MKGFPGAAGPRKGADQTIAGQFRTVLQAAFCGPPIAREAERDGAWLAGPGGRRIVGVGSDAGPHFVWAAIFG